ncbi:MAG: 6,7-dimethyl-8-ribityllumazine synthase [Lentisphaerae bacterium]|jgi:6,7-dimethyl-8-ribityllumazine synthase|nr:6,7-dimethyl-8-ribityllumazine synthase [Lentisphaerota bacterium]
MSRKLIEGQLNAQGMRVALLVSRFNSFLTSQLLEGASDCLVRHGASEADLTVVWVPGANEIPMAAKAAAVSGNYDAVVALGAVIRGATTHADLINTQVSRALSAIALESGVPVLNGVVSAESLEQGIERSGTKAGNKGWDAALAAIEIVSVLKQL